MIAALAPVAPRLGQLLRMALGSDSPGEVVNAARAINRTLKGAGMDHHSLAALIESNISTISRLETENADLRARLAAVTAERDDGGDDWTQKVEWLVEKRWGFLRPKERGFLKDLQAWRGQPTEKQADWLDAIYQREREPAHV